jgi:hypothetical protein
MSTAAASGDTKAIASLRSEIDSTEKVLPDFTKSGPSFVIQGDRDITMSVGGVLRNEYVRQYRAELMNKDVEFDKYAAHNGRIEVDSNIAYGTKRYGRPVIELGNRMRQKYQAGRFDKAVGLSAASVKENDVLIDAPSRGVNAPVQWAKHLWAKVDLNAVFNRTCPNTHSLKVGLFDFSLGKGIAYGPIYGTQKSYMGVFTATNDFAPYGINLNGNITKNWMYDLYFARFEEKSADFKQTSARTKAHVVGNRASGAAGAEKSNDIFAARSTMVHDFKSAGELKSELYVMHNKADDQRVEMNNDSYSRLTTVGFGIDYKKGNFELSSEVALNTGHEQMLAVDRNQIKFASHHLDTDYNMMRTYSHVSLVETEADLALDGKKAPVTVETQALVNAYDGNTNDISLGVDTATVAGNTYTLKNAADRFRPAYRNDYRGWMLVGDMAYDWKAANMKVAASFGHASGDNNPHESEVDKKYHGFLGLNENYAGGRVTSVLVLNARKVQRALTSDAGKKVTIDNSFTDMTFAGTGLTWNVAKKDLQIKVNALAFWKDKPAYAYVYNPVADTGAFDTGKNARSHLGTEANLQFEWKLLPGLQLAADFAVFFPGGHYEDRKGLPMDGSIVESMDSYDPTGIGQTTPRLGTDPILHMNIGMQYKF